MAKEFLPRPVQTHLSIYVSPEDKLGAGIHGGCHRFLNEIRGQTAAHGWPTDLITNAQAGELYRFSEIQSTPQGEIYVQPGIIQLPLTDEQMFDSTPRVLVDPKVRERAVAQIEKIVRDRQHGITSLIAHHYTSAELACRIPHLDKPIIVVPHTLKTFRDAYKRPSLERSSSELYSLFLADVIVLFTEAEKQIIMNIVNNLKIDSSQDYSIDHFEQRLRRQLERMLNKCKIIPLGVDHDRFSPALQQPDRKREARGKMDLPTGNQIIFGVVGRITKIKNIETVIDAFDMFLQSHPNQDVYLSIFGGNKKDFYEEGTYMHQLRKRIEMKRNKDLANKIIFTGSQDPTDIMAAIDVEISASYSESWGLAITEAMATGIPTIVSDEPVMREVTGNTQIYFNPRKPAELARRMLEISRNPSQRKEIGENGFRVARNYIWAETSSELMRLTLGEGINGNLYTLNSVTDELRRFPWTDTELQILGGLSGRGTLLENLINQLKNQIAINRIILTSLTQPIGSIMARIDRLSGQTIVQLTEDKISKAKVVVKKLEDDLGLKEAASRELWLVFNAELALRIGDLPLVIKYLDDAIAAFNHYIQILPDGRLRQEYIEAEKDIQSMKIEIQSIIAERAKIIQVVFPKKKPAE